MARRGERPLPVGPSTVPEPKWDEVADRFLSWAAGLAVASGETGATKPGDDLEWPDVWLAALARSGSSEVAAAA